MPGLTLEFELLLINNKIYDVEIKLDQIYATETELTKLITQLKNLRLRRGVLLSLIRNLVSEADL